MKTRYTLFVLGFALLLIASCNREDISITYFKQLQSTSDNTNKEDSLMMPCGFIEYDSVRFSDGSYAVHRLQYAPQNSLTEFFDNKGRTIATIARASECYAQTLVYDYDDEGRLSHLLQYKSEIFEGLDSDSASYGRNKDGYLGFRQMIADMVYEHPDTAKYQQTNIEYDKDGDAVKAYMVYGSDSIVAPSGYKLTIAVKPCLSFWQSDLHGGFYIFHVTMEPKRKDLQNYKVCRFADYLPSMDSEYRNGRIVKTVWHHDPCIESDDKDLVFIPIITDDLNVYSVTWEDGSKHQRVYKDGLLAYKQEISKYGTALKKETYSFLSDKKVKVTFETIDYKTKALKIISTSVMNVPNMEKFREDMNVISGNYRWENYYNKLKLTDMDKNKLKDAYDIGENMAVFSGEGRSYTIINKETGKTRQLVSEDGSLLVTDNEIDFDAIYKGCPDFNGCKSVRYWFGRYDNFRNGVCAICWTIYPDGRYFADEDGFGMEDNDEENAYCIINKDLEIIVPFQPMDDVKEMLKKYEK